METVNNICGFCNGSGMDAGQEVCKPCGGTGIDSKHHASKIHQLREELVRLNNELAQKNYDYHQQSKIVEELEEAQINLLLMLKRY